MAQRFDLKTIYGVQMYVRACYQPSPASGQVQRLAGSWSGFVYRVHIETTSGQICSFIVKHVEGYAARHSEFKIGTERLDYEAKGLKLLKRPDTEFRSVRTPKLFHHDPNSHVLIMQDAGNHPTLKNWLHADTPPKQIVSVGQTLGSYLAHIHNITADDTATKNDFGPDAVGKVVSSSVYFSALPAAAENFGYQQTFITIAANADAQEILTANDVWTFGDFWTGNVLVNTPNEHSEPQVVVLDFELAKPGTRAFDIGQMGAEMLCLARFRHPEQGTVLLRTFFQAYRAESKVRVDAAAVAIRIGAHLFTITPRTWMAETGEKRVKEVLEEAIDLLRMGWEKDFPALRRSIVGDLMT